MMGTGFNPAFFGPAGPAGPGLFHSKAVLWIVKDRQSRKYPVFPVYLVFRVYHFGISSFFGRKRMA